MICKVLLISVYSTQRKLNVKVEKNKIPNIFKRCNEERTFYKNGDIVEYIKELKYFSQSIFQIRVILYSQGPPGKAEKYSYMCVNKHRKLRILL